MIDFKQSTENQVLLIDPLTETSRNTAFLLGLANYQVTIAKGLDESINHVSIFSPNGYSPTVILIDNLQASAATSRLIELLADRYRNVSILLVGRPDQSIPFGMEKFPIVTSRHILHSLRTTILQSTCNNDASDCFHCIHSYGG